MSVCKRFRCDGTRYTWNKEKVTVTNLQPNNLANVRGARYAVLPARLDDMFAVGCHDTESFFESWISEV